MKADIRSSFRFAAFARDQRGQFGLLMSLTAAATVLTMGLGIDFYAKISTKSRIDAAADAAALAAVNSAKAYFAQNSGMLSGSALVSAAENAGQATGLRAFSVNLGSSPVNSPVTPNIAMSYSNLQFGATVTWSGAVQTFFGSLAGVSTLSISGSAAAVAQLPEYEDFYVVADVSASMAIPTTTSNQNLLLVTNPDNVWSNVFYQHYGQCQFACHFPGNASFAYTQQSDGAGGVRIPLKLNDAGTALNNLLAAAVKARVIANQYRIGIYPYILHAIQAAPLSSDLSPGGTVAQVANNLVNYIDNGGSNGGMGSGGTHFYSIWNDLKAFLNPVGDGSQASAPKPFIIVITDGVDNTQSYVAPIWFNTNGGSTPVLPDTTSAASVCTQAKNLGYTVAVLLIPYSPIVRPQTLYNDEDDVVNYYINPSVYPKPAVAPTMPPGDNVVVNMQACASPRYFFQADSAANINAAMQQIFQQATSNERLTQ